MGYFNWMVNAIDDGRGSEYTSLLAFLNNVPYTFILLMDENRLIDGYDMRSHYVYETGLNDIPGDEVPVSVLEVMVALVLRIDKEYTGDYGNNAPVFFWSMVKNLNLLSMSNDIFDMDYVMHRVEIWLTGNYEPNGRGGLFTVDWYDGDLRQIDIWYQAMWWLETNALM